MRKRLVSLVVAMLIAATMVLGAPLTAFAGSSYNCGKQKRHKIVKCNKRHKNVRCGKRHRYVKHRRYHRVVRYKKRWRYVRGKRRLVRVRVVVVVRR